MFKHLTHQECVNALLDDEYAAWTHDQAVALINWYEEFEGELGYELALDVVSVRVNWTAYTLAEIREQFPDYADVEDDDALIENMRDATVVLQVDDDNYILQDF